MTDEKEFMGVTMRDCCVDCSEKRCVITGSPFCGHPFKASHPGAAPKVKERIAKVKKMVLLQKMAASA